MRIVPLPRWLAGLTVGVLLVLTSAMAAADAPPKVWTNEDLERMFGPSDAPASPLGAPESSAAQWDAVESFLERQYRRIEEEKQRELQRDEIRAAYPPREPGYALGLAPRFGSGWWWPGNGCGIAPGRPGDGWRPGPSPYRSQKAGVPYHDPRRHSGHALVPRTVSGSTGVSRSAGAVNPVGRPVSSSARSVNPASAR